MVTLTRKTNTVEITFDGSPTYLYNGTISVPLGCLVLITDASDMATFRRAPSYDVLFSARIADLEFDEQQATKPNINRLFNDTCGGGGRGSGDMDDYYTKEETDAALSGKADTSAVTAAISAATSGKANSADVYTKQEMDTALSGKADTSAVTAAISAATSGKANVSDVYTKTEIDQSSRVVSEALHELHDEKADTSAVTASISAATSGKANSADVYTKTEMDTALSGKADTTAMTAAISAATSGKANASDVYTKTEVDAALSGKANSADVYAKTDVDNAPTSGSTNLLTSGTLYNVLGDIDTALTNIIGGN